MKHRHWTNDETDSGSKQIEFDSDSASMNFQIFGGTHDNSERLGCCKSVLIKVWDATFGKVGGDWFYLFLLGILMAWISLLVEYGIGLCINARIYLYRDLSTHPFLQYLAWLWLPVCLILFSTSLTLLLAPQAAGSGIPEMKTILNGVPLKESFTFKTFVAKTVGLTATLGTGLPLGKEGPFVHIASIAAILLVRATRSFRKAWENKSRNTEMLAVACAVGVATAFAAPIGGVLFSIEVTAVHFAVRNYWRGFFAAVCGTMMHRLLAVWFKEEETLTALFRTSFTLDTPFATQEVITFAIIGASCGLLGAFFVWCHRRFVVFKNTNHFMKKLSKKSFLLYPLLVTILYTTLTFPLGWGMFIAGDLTTHQQVTGMFANFSWLKSNPSIQEFGIISRWRNPYSGFFLNLIFYIIFTFLGTILASTIPVPAGIFIPVFKMGAAFGRLAGETMQYIFSANRTLIPGGYSIVGAAALAGAATHTVSSSVIAFELTGQITYAIPVMIAVFIANGVAQMLQPSIFDSIIAIKKLPCLPTLLSTSSRAYDIYVEDFMIKNVKFIWYGITYNELKNILLENDKIKFYPIVDSADSMILLGSAQRTHLISLIEEALSFNRKEFFPKHRRTTDTAKSRMKIILEEGTVASEKMTEIHPKSMLNLPSISNSENSLENIGKSMELGTIPNLGRYSNHDRSFISNSSADLTKDNGRLDFKTGEDVLQEIEKSSEMSCDLPNTERRPSRFSVVRVEEFSSVRMDEKQENDQKDVINNSIPKFRALPTRKGILKKTNSFALHPFMAEKAQSNSSYTTIHSGDSRNLKRSLSTILRNKASIKADWRSSINLKNEMLSKRLAEKFDQEMKWEEEQLKKTVDFSQCLINPAPHQLVERSNLIQVHSIFSLLGLSHSYVTAIGRLIGVVSLRELREVIEQVNAGDFVKHGVPNYRKYSLGFISLI